MLHHFESSLKLKEMVFLELIFAIFLTGSAYGAELIFPPERNNLKPLPIRFEYSLVSKDQIKVGNTLIDARQIELQFQPINSDFTQYKIVLRWPSDFLKKGELVIKDPAGKSVWSVKPNASNIKFEKSKIGKQAFFETDKNTQALIDELKKIPFFKFCVFKEEPQARVYLCSKDMFVKPRSQPIVIEPRDSFRKESFVEINGEPVDQQGVIVLNDKKDFVSMRSLMLSGATLEIETKLQAIEFLDVSLDPKSESLFVTAIGHKPIESTQVETLGSNKWKAKMDAERPFLFVLGQGDIPLRQEFLVQGPIKNTELKIDMNVDQNHSVFKDSATVELTSNQPVTIESVDKTSVVEKISDTKFVWKISSLEKGKINRKWLKVISGSDSFLGKFDLNYEDSKSFLVRLYAPLWYQVDLETIINETLQGYFSFERNMQKATDESNVSAMSLGFVNRGIGHFKREGGPLIGLELSKIDLESESTVGIGIVLGADRDLSPDNAKEKLLLMGKLNYYLNDLSGTLKSKSTYRAEVGFRKFLPSKGYFEFGVRAHSFVFESKDFAEYKNAKASVFVGFGTLF